MKVWDFLSNPEQIAKCMPGLQQFVMEDAKTFTVSVKVGISFVRGDFKFIFHLLEQEAPSHSRFEADGRGAGVSVRMNTTMDIKEIQPCVTELYWKTDAELGGLLGELSPSLLQTSTNKLLQEFFSTVQSKLERE